MTQRRALIATLGTREIQFVRTELEAAGWRFEAPGGEARRSERLIDPKGELSLPVLPNRNFEDYYALDSARSGGALVLAHFDAFAPFLKMPLLKDALALENLAKVVLVFTDQGEDPEVKDIHKQQDTLHLAKIIGRYIERQHPGLEVADFACREQLANMDAQYDRLDVDIAGIDLDGYDEILLLAQGGIDQVNTALTLRLIEHVGPRLRVIQKPESEPLQYLDFSRKFLRNIQKHKILALLEQHRYYNIAKDMDLPKGDPVRLLAQYAYARLWFDYVTVRQTIVSAKSKSLYLPAAEDDFQNSWIRLKDLYYGLRLHMDAGNYREASIAIITFFENVHRAICESILGSDTQSLYIWDSNSDNPNLRAYVGEALWSELKNKVQQMVKPKPKLLYNPNPAFWSILSALLQDKGYLPSELSGRYHHLLKVENRRLVLTSKRNELIHNMASISANSARQLFYDLDNNRRSTLFTELDQFFGIEDSAPFGLYSEIEKLIRQTL